MPVLWLKCENKNETEISEQSERKNSRKKMTEEEIAKKKNEFECITSPQGRRQSNQKSLRRLWIDALKNTHAHTKKKMRTTIDPSCEEEDGKSPKCVPCVRTRKQKQRSERYERKRDAKFKGGIRKRKRVEKEEGARKGLVLCVCACGGAACGVLGGHAYLNGGGVLGETNDFTDELVVTHTHQFVHACTAHLFSNNDCGNSGSGEGVDDA